MLILAIPSAVILIALVWHSLGALPRRRAVAFWMAVVVYAVLRGVAERFVTETTGTSFPDAIGTPLLMMGVAILFYLAWWIGGRWTYLVAQVALASIFLGAIGWAFVPEPPSATGVVEWFFAGVDFLLPFAAITAGWRWRYATLLFLPAHWAGHLLPAPYLPIVHGALALIVATVALRTTFQDRPFADVRSWVPTAAFTLIMLEVAIVQTAVAHRPRLLLLLVPAVLIWVSVLRGARLRWLRRNWVVTLVAIVVIAIAVILAAASGF
jgi:hypothetical protein